MKKTDYFNRKAWLIIWDKDEPWDEQTQREYAKVVDEYQTWKDEVNRKRNAFHPKCCCKKCLREFNSNMFIRSRPYLCPECRSPLRHPELALGLLTIGSQLQS